jgi:hypothetical protein
MNMNRVKYEKPQRGNPHQFAINQHVFPAASIARFADKNGTVSLADGLRQKVRRAKPNDHIFCAKRAWDHRSETGYMRSIEGQFQQLASRIIEGAVTEIGDSEKNIVDRFWSLWYMRALNRTLESQEVQARGIIGGSMLTQDQEENLEKNGYMFAREGGRFLARQLNGMKVQIGIDRYHGSLSETKWGIIHAEEGEFVVPDAPTCTIVPLTPTLCIAASPVSGTIVFQNVAEINRAVVDHARSYFFARDLSKCPIAIKR